MAKWMKQARRRSGTVLRRPAAAAAQILKRPAAAPNAKAKTKCTVRRMRKPSSKSRASSQAAKRPVDLDKPANHLLTDLSQDGRDTLIQNLSRGIEFTTDYSGSGQAERAMQNLTELAEALDPAAELKTVCTRSCDILPHCRQVLHALPGDGCVMADMTERLPPALRTDIENIIAAYQAKLVKQLQEFGKKKDRAFTQQLGDAFVAEVAHLMLEHKLNGSFDPNLKLPCTKHGKLCPVYPVRGSSVGGCPLKGNASGISCIDWSERGSQAGSFGKGAVAWCTFMWDLLNDDLDWALLERTRHYRHPHLEVVLAHIGASVLPVVFSHSQLGLPCTRYRKYMLILFSPSLRWNSNAAAISMTSLLSSFGRKPAGSGSDFLQKTPKSEVRAEIEAMAENMHMSSRDGSGNRWPMKIVLSRSMQRSLAAHDGQLKKGGWDLTKDGVFTTICQQGSYAATSAMIPALLQRSKVWSWRHQRLLLPRERRNVMGIEWTPEIASIEPSKICSMTGNAMNLTAISSVIVYMLSTCIPEG
mmetsp:Transcript_34568/g.112453  ORF Transcript_34568/g.112453 Transcript_34568/m.112453 type:complete len:530 (+) Transcript_34568:170-1759(+)